MPELSMAGAVSAAVTEPLNLNADKLLHQAASPSAVNAKIDKSSKDFESILLSSWLQQAEQSFGSLPGSDDGDDDSGKEQFLGIAMQSMGASLAASGGIGIAKMIANSLHKAEDARVGQEAKTHPPPAK
jgi:Rod binding domain-containing protein